MTIIDYNLVHGESIKTRYFLKELEKTAEKYSVELKSITYEEIQDGWAADLVRAAKEGKVSEDEIDARREANPLCTGCYVTRGSLKWLNRELEYLLFAAGLPFGTRSFTGLYWQSGVFHLLDTLPSAVRRIPMRPPKLTVRGLKQAYQPTQSSRVYRVAEK